MKQAVILVGVSGSGKSTIAKTYLEHDWQEINRDDVRTQILKKDNGVDVDNENIWKHWNFKWEKKVNPIIDEKVETCIQDGINMVFSDTNLNPDRVAALISRLEAYDYKVEVRVIDVDIETCIKRDLYRKNSVGQDVIWDQYKKFRAVYPKYNLKDVNTKPKAIIFDIDGTCTLGPHNRSPFEWNKVGQDKPNDVVLTSMIGLSSMNYEIIFMSGRDSVCRQQTIDWIYANTTLNKDYIDEHLFMRAENDMRKDYLVKLELFFAHIDGKFKVESVFDDRPQVIKNVWLELGIPTICVGHPYIDF